MSRLKRVLYSKWGVPLRWAHRGAVAAMLVWLRLVGRLSREPGPDPKLAELATIAVKTFQRPHAMTRFLKGAREVFAGRIVVVDDSRVPWSTKDPLVDVITMEFDSGVSAGRNRALAAVETPYVLVTDDDLVFNRLTSWARALDYLERNPEVDAVAGLVVELPRWYSLVVTGNALFAGHAAPIRQPEELIDGLPVRLKPPQVYLARTASIRKVGWDPELKRVDHNDFFSRASGTLVFVQDQAIPVFHARTPWNKSYTSYRNDTGGDLARLSAKWAARHAEGSPLRPLPEGRHA